MFLLLFSLALSACAPNTQDVAPSMPAEHSAQLLWLVTYDPVGFIDKVEADREIPANWVAIGHNTAAAITEMCGLRLTSAPTSVSSCELASACAIVGLPADPLRAFCGSCEGVYPDQQFAGCGKISGVPPSTFQYAY